MKKIKFAILGCGHIGKRYASILKKNANAELCALIDIKDKASLNISELSVPFFGSLSEFLESDINVDVICIGTPNGYHYEQAIQCLNKRIHVIIEKPIALKKAHAKEILTVAKKNDRHVFTVMQNRYSPAAIWLKSIVEQQLLGDIFMVQTNCFWNRDDRYYNAPDKNWRGTREHDGGVLYTQFSHFIDMLYWLFGDIENISARLKNFNHRVSTQFADSGMVNFDFVNGGMGALNFSTSVWNANMESSLTIVAENGAVKMGGQYMNQVQYCDIKNYENSFPNKNGIGSHSEISNNHTIVIANVINFLKGDSYKLPLPKDSVAVIDIIERIYQADTQVSPLIQY